MRYRIISIVRHVAKFGKGERGRRAFSGHLIETKKPDVRHPATFSSVPEERIIDGCLTNISNVCFFRRTKNVTQNSWPALVLFPHSMFTNDKATNDSLKGNKKRKRNKSIHKSRGHMQAVGPSSRRHWIRKTLLQKRKKKERTGLTQSASKYRIMVSESSCKRTELK